MIESHPLAGCFGQDSMNKVNRNSEAIVPDKDDRNDAEVDFIMMPKMLDALIETHDCEETM